MDKSGNSFIRQTIVSVSPEKKALLIRRGNTLFNEGRVLDAKRIFLTIGYRDGLKRVGDYYLEEKDFVEALRLYQAASHQHSLTRLAKGIAESLRYWIQE